MSDPSWQLHPKVHPMTVGTFLDSVMDLGSAAEGLLDKKSLFDIEGGWRLPQAIVRQISVPLRKLCLDDEGALLKKTICQPDLPSPRRPKGSIPPRNAIVALGTPRSGLRRRKREEGDSRRPRNQARNRDWKTVRRRLPRRRVVRDSQPFRSHGAPSSNGCAEQPDRTLAELKDALGTPASLATIWRAVAALDVTVKKNGPALRTRSTWRRGRAGRVARRRADLGSDTPGFSRRNRHYEQSPAAVWSGPPRGPRPRPRAVRPVADQYVSRGTAGHRPDRARGLRRGPAPVSWTG